MKILNGTVVNNPLAHIFELSDYMVVSGSIYNKNPMYPLPLKFGLLEDANSSVYFKEIYDVSENAVVRYRSNKNTYIPDKKDYKTHYTFYDNLGMYKMIENDDGLEITRFQFEPAEDNYSIEYSMQTDKYIVFIIQYSASAMLYVVNKSDLSVLISKNFQYYLTTLGFFYDKYEDKYYLHLFSRISLTSGASYLYSVELESMTATTVKTCSSASNYKFVSDVVRYTDSKSYLVVRYASNSYPYLLSYTITDTSSANMIANKLYDSKYSGIEGEKIVVLNPEPNYISTLEVNENNNISISTNYSYICTNKFALSNDQILDFSGEWDATSDYSSHPQNEYVSDEHQIYNYNVCGKIKDDKTIFFANQEKIVIYKWDTENKKYILHNEFFDKFEKIGIDANYNVWVRNADKDLYTLDIDYSDYEVIISADETDFDYINADINTTIRVKAIDRNENHVRCHVILKIDGAAKFTDNGKQVMEIDLIGEEMEIPITIFDQGFIHIVYLH